MDHQGEHSACEHDGSRYNQRGQTLQQGDARHHTSSEKAVNKSSSSIVAPHRDGIAPARRLPGLLVLALQKKHANIYVLIYKENALQDRTERSEIDHFWRTF